MKTGFNSKLKRWIMLLLPLLVVGLFLAACDGDDDNANEIGAGGGLDVEETAVVEEPDVDTEDPLDGDDEVIEETPAVFPTPVADDEITDTVTPEATMDAGMEMGMVDGVIQSSDLIGIEVLNQAGETIGTVTEALAQQNGTIERVLVSLDTLMTADEFGDTGDMAEFAGETDLVAVSWADLNLQTNAVNEELLDSDRDFAAVLTGDMANMSVTPLDTNFNTFLGEGDYVLDEGLDADMNVPAQFANLLQISEFDSFEIQNTTDEDLGDVEDLLIGTSTGEIMYAVVDVGGFLGIGENEVVIPWSAVTLDQATLGDAQEIFRVNVDQNFLENAPTIDLSGWTFDVEEGWDEEFQSFWADVESDVSTEIDEETDMETGQAITAGVVQASELVDIEVWNQFGEQIGEVTEILAQEDGSIQQVIVDLNTFVNEGGLGADVDTTDFVAETDLVAMSWDSLNLQQDAGDEELIGDDVDFVAVVSGNIAADMNLTPLDPNFLTFMDADDNIVDEGVDTDMDVPAEFAGLIQLSEYDGFELQSTTDEDLGDVEDLLIDLSNGQVVYAIVDVGGFLGIGENEVAIPWSAVTLDETTLGEAQEVFQADVDATFLESAPTIDLDGWDFDVDEGWDEEFQSYWSDFD